MITFRFRRTGPGGLLLAIGLMASATLTATVQAEDFQRMRKEMVERYITGGGITNERVIKSLGDTERHQFVDLRFRLQSYEDMALPIGEQQTISSPFIVAYMTEQLDPRPTDKVLEIGTGSGYQAAVLSPLVKSVYTIEIVQSLGLKARRTLERLGYRNVYVKIGDGFKGWPEHAPFDKIIVTCSPESVPTPLVEQLVEGGRMVIPVGERYNQTLYLFRKKDGKLVPESLRPTLFVPMTGAAERARKIKPDPANPKIDNGGFEELTAGGTLPAGWYYGRQMKLVADDKQDRAPEGKNFLTFTNETPDRRADILQGFPVDGRKVAELKISLRVRANNVRPGSTLRELPRVSVLFFDESRASVGVGWIEPWHSTFDWTTRSGTIRVPRAAREAALRVGMHGGTGEISVDDIKLEKPNPVGG